MKNRDKDKERERDIEKCKNVHPSINKSGQR